MSYGKIFAAFWTDEKIINVSDDAKLVACYLITGPHRNMIGCSRVPAGYIAEDLRWATERVTAALAQLAGCRFIVRDAAGWTLIVNLLKYDPLTSPNHGAGAQRLFREVPRGGVSRALGEKLLSAFEALEERHPSKCQGLAKGFAKELASLSEGPSKDLPDTSEGAAQDPPKPPPSPPAGATQAPPQEPPDTRQGASRGLDTPGPGPGPVPDTSSLRSEVGARAADAAAPPPPAGGATAAPKARKATREKFPLPPDWAPNDAQMAYAFELRLSPAQVNTARVGFVAYWTTGAGSAGPKSVKTEPGWNQAWWNWIRIESDRLSRGRGNGGSGGRRIDPAEQERQDSASVLRAMGPRLARGEAVADPGGRGEAGPGSDAGDHRGPAAGVGEADGRRDAQSDRVVPVVQRPTGERGDDDRGVGPGAAPPATGPADAGIRDDQARPQMGQPAAAAQRDRGDGERRVSPPGADQDRPVAGGSENPQGRGGTSASDGRGPQPGGGDVGRGEAVPGGNGAGADHAGSPVRGSESPASRPAGVTEAGEDPLDIPAFLRREPPSAQVH